MDKREEASARPGPHVQLNGWANASLPLPGSTGPAGPTFPTSGATKSTLRVPHCTATVTITALEPANDVTYDKVFVA